MFFGRKKNTKDTFILKIEKAFPHALKEEIEATINILPQTTYHDVSIGISDETIRYALENEFVEIPYRIYLLEISDLSCCQLNEVQKKILYCFYTRSCDGYIREKYLKELLKMPLEEWVIPFIVKLCDEYVVEIIETVYDTLKHRENFDIKSFCLKNSIAIWKSYARMISYWNEYYRGRESNLCNYVGRKLFRECFGYDRTFEKKAFRESLLVD